MRVMSLNVWSDTATTPPNPVELREDGILNTIKEYLPDFIGMQEFSPAFYSSKLFSELEKEYACIGMPGNTWTPVFYKKSLYTLRECGWKWFDELPPLPYIDDSKGITWAVLEEKETEKCFGMCSTHLWFKNGPEHDAVRVNNAKQLLEKMTYIKSTYNATVFAVGDFNCNLDSDAIKFLEENGVYSSVRLTDDFSKSATYHGYPTIGDDGKYHGTPADSDYTKSIDHIVTFKDDVRVIKQDIIVNDEILGSTDHSPVYVDIEII